MGPKPHFVPTVRATEIPVWATENPVTLTVTAQTLALRRLPEPPFRAFSKEILEYLTIRRSRYMVCAVLCQNQRPRACVISDRGGTRWVLWALSKLTCVKGVIAHSSHAAGNAGRCPAVAGPISPPSRKYGLEIWPALWRRYGRR